MRETGLALLRTPFPANQISKLPKPTKAQTEEVRANFKAGIRCEVCGAWHHPKVVHLDYVGHAALTDRLLDADSAWSWEPLAIGPDSHLPVMDEMGGMWIKLTVCNVTRLGYGHAGEKQGGDAIKEVIGDALRNAAMRFGAALDLWHKGDLHVDEDVHKEDVPTKTAKGVPMVAPDKRTPSVAQTVMDQEPAIPGDRTAYIDGFASDMIAEANEGRTPLAILDAIEAEKFDDTEKIYLSTRFPSALRNAITAESRKRYAKP